jgi:hypothetical protein
MAWLAKLAIARKAMDRPGEGAWDGGGGVDSIGVAGFLSMIPKSGNRFFGIDHAQSSQCGMTIRRKVIPDQPRHESSKSHAG